jgi:CRISPR/Cas system-associated exonuclease Cas4 (RecB family)
MSENYDYETDFINNHRIYKIKSDNENILNYPSVTSITGMYFENYLNHWKKRVGEEYVETEMDKAKRRGTDIHSMIENYLKNQNKPQENNPNILMFNNMISEIDKIDKILKIEHFLLSHELEVAGTVDCIGYYEDVLSVIDFKTSKRKKYKSNCKNYFMQCAAYAACYNEMYSEKIENLVIIMGVDQDNKCLVFKSKLSDHIDNFKIFRNKFRIKYSI